MSGLCRTWLSKNMQKRRERAAAESRRMFSKDKAINEEYVKSNQSICLLASSHRRLLSRFPQPLDGIYQQNRRHAAILQRRCIPWWVVLRQLQEIMPLHPSHDLPDNQQQAGDIQDTSQTIAHVSTEERATEAIPRTGGGSDRQALGTCSPGWRGGTHDGPVFCVTGSTTGCC